MDAGIDLRAAAMRIAHRIRAIAVKETIPVGKGSKKWTKSTRNGIVEGGHDKQGGELRRSISVSGLDGGAVVGTNKAYARAVHEGRKAIIIRPKKKRALAWNEGNSAAKRVYQPARSGNPFFRNAVDRFEADFDREARSLGIEEGLAEGLRVSLRNKGLMVRANG
jgi:phage gpG-like protein